MQTNLIDRVKNIIMTPKTEWPTIEGEPTSVVELYQNYIAILAAIPVVAQFLRGVLFGYSVGALGAVRIGLFSGLAHAIVEYVLALVMTYLVALLVSYLAPYFGGAKDDLRALKLVAYSYTPAWVAGVFALIPGLGFLAIVGLWSLYLFYLGAPRLARVPEDKAIPFTAVAVVAAIVLAFVVGIIVYAIVPGPGFGTM